LNRFDGATILNTVNTLITGLVYNSLINSYLNIVSPYLGRISTHEVGALPGINNSSSIISNKALIYLAGVDNYMIAGSGSFLVYQGIFKTNNFLFSQANLIFPTTSFVERSSSFLNIEGRLRFTKKVIIPFKFIFSD